MRLLLSALLLSALSIAARAEPQTTPSATPKIESATVIKAGIMKFGDTPEVINDGKISTGQRTTAQDVQVTEETTTIPLTLNRVFGLEFKLAGAPSDGRPKLRVVWRYPNNGIKSPGGKSKYSDVYEDNFSIGNTEALYWYLGASYTLVPGRWTVELWDGERRLLSEDFNLMKPDATAGASGDAEQPSQSPPDAASAPVAATNTSPAPAADSKPDIDQGSDPDKAKTDADAPVAVPQP